MPDLLQIRRATLADIDIIARHRAGMFRDMGVLPAALAGRLAEMTRSYLEEALPSGDYVGWLASLATDTNRVVAGAGVLVRRVPPFPRQRSGVAAGRQALVLNVYTEPAFRRQGAARALMHEVMSWARDHDIDSLVLHAAPDGRPLYEALGFEPTTEMHFTGDLASWKHP